MKKFRGQKRYYDKKLRKRVNNFELDLGKDSWYNMWHTHMDWPGYSNLGWKHRRSHLKMLFAVFQKAIQQLDGFREPYQLFLFIDYFDGSSDAIYFHTPNPHGDFPVKLEGVNWGVQPHCLFKDLLDSDLRVGFTVFENQKLYYVFSSKHGVGLD